ncbi:MAG: helix-turn-helix transcriptional regulator [Kiritimatiellae bacterium]|nr:helix-turn-helix transcriptional regulator [Kiritimatiellia bacterium]
MKASLYMCTHAELLNDPRFSIAKCVLHRTLKPRWITWQANPGQINLIFYHDPVLIEAAGTRTAVPANTLVPWPPGEPRAYGNKETDWCTSAIDCGGSYVKEVLCANGFAWRQPVMLPDAYVWESYLEAIRRELVTYERPSRTLLENLFENWMIELRRAANPPEPASTLPERLRRVVGHVNRRLASEMTLARLAALAGLSKRHFSAEFTRHMHVSPIDYVIARRMERAAFLLADAELTVSEIGVLVGYPDLFYFSRLFKKHYGKSPTAFREQRQAGRGGPRDRARRTARWRIQGEAGSAPRPAWRKTSPAP